MFTTDVMVRAIPVRDWLDRYCFPGRFLDCCKACPDYGRVWSCPPGVPEAEAYLGRFTTAYIVGARVIYAEEDRWQALKGPEEAEAVRQRTYGVAKKALLEALLALEKLCPGSLAVAAGRCEQCAACTRPEGLPCRKPERMRYSFSAFGFDLSAVAKELLGLDLLWASQGLPEYNAALAAFLTE